MESLFGFTSKMLEDKIGALGREKYRSRQIFQWVYNRGVLDFNEMTNISKGLRTIFSEIFDTALLKIRDVIPSTDGSIKFGFEAEDGNVIESVFMPDEKRNTVCLSTQIGCRMGCRFCVTGRMGFVRNLSTAEIIRQLVTIKHHIPDQRISNVVFMGMGEPLDNLSNLIDAINILRDPMGLSFSRRKITLSTVGILGGLKMIGQNEVGLAISLNAADEETRGLIMPINRLYPLRDVIEFARGLNLGRRERVTFEYVMIKGINDSLDDAKRLSGLLTGIRCKINLIPYNESSIIDYKAPDPKAVEEFHAFLLRRHYTAIVRKSRGQDIMGGCGQLGIRYLIERGNK